MKKGYLGGSGVQAPAHLPKAFTSTGTVMRSLRLTLYALLLLPAFATHAAPVRAAVFGFQWDDTSLQGEIEGKNPTETARVQMLDTLLNEKLTQAGYDLVDTAPVATQIKQQDFQNCAGCDVALARRLGANVSVVGWVQKVSNLILDINLVIRDAKTGDIVRAGSVSIRGNTDESWRRGLDYLLTERILLKNQVIAQ